MKVVSNAGPLIALAKLDRLDLLSALYGHVLIPFEVQREIRAGVALGYGHARAIAALIDSGEIQVLQAKPVEIEFKRRINLGEVGAILLALQEKATLVLIDDLDARIEAERLSLQVRGTVGILVAGVRQNLITDSEAVKLLETIEKRPDIWISKQVTQAAINDLLKR